MNLRINGRKIIENKRLITPSRSVENVVVDKYNQYKKSDYVAKPGVVFESSTCTDIDVQNLTVR